MRDKQTNSNRSSNRRRLLATVAAGVTAGVAGCLGGDSDDESDTGSENGDGSDTGDGSSSAVESIDGVEYDDSFLPRLELLAVDTPTDVVFGDTFELKVAFGNTGGEPVENNAEVRLVRLAAGSQTVQTARLNASGLEPGEINKHTIGPFDAVAADSFTLKPGGRRNESDIENVREAADVVFDIQPQRGSLGQQFEFPDGPRFTVTNVALEQSAWIENEVFAGDDGPQFNPKLVQTLDDRILALMTVRVENATTTAQTVPAETFGTEQGDIISEPPELAERDDAPIPGQTVNPGSQTDGYVLAKYDIQALPDAEIGLYAAGTSGPPDVTVDCGYDSVPAIPRYELAESTMKEASVNENDGGPAVDIEFEVKNTGDDVGTFQGVAQYKTSNAGIFSPHEENEWFGYEKFVATLAPDNSETFTTGFDLSDDYDDLLVRIQPFGAEFDIFDA